MGDLAMPDHFGPAAERFWREVTGQYQLRPDEVRILEDACREMDVVDFLDKQLRSDGFELMIRGSQGQMVMNPVFAELRQHRAATRQLLKQLGLPDSDESAADRSSKMRDLANRRWNPRSA